MGVTAAPFRHHSAATMRLSLPLALIALLTSALADLIDENVSQRPLSNFYNDAFGFHAQGGRPPHPSQPTIASTTLIDALSADGNYTRLITLLQKARLVPTLNRLNGTTFFAPTNDAIQKNALFRTESEAWGDDEHSSYETEDQLGNLGKDNVNEKLREQLLYHLLQTRLQELPKEFKVHQTYLYPRPHSDPSNTTEKPPSTPPWIPVPGGTLDGEPQRIRVSLSDDKSWVATDFKGQGGVSVVRPLVEADNGVLIGIADVIQPPPNLAELIESHDSLGYFRKILPEALKADIQNGSAMTLFLPQDSAWDSLNNIERLYLESEFSDDDVRRVVNMHTIKSEKKAKTPVRWSDTWANGTNLTSVFGEELEIRISDTTTTISGAEILQPDIYASNGVLHLVSSLLVPADALTLTVEKYLLALNCTKFVSLLRSASLSNLINDTSASYTILAPSNDVLSLHSDDDFPPVGSDDLPRYLKYHFLPGKWTRDNLRDGMLVETALDEDGLSGKRQVLSVSTTPDTKGLSFGGVGVIGEVPIETNNNTIIYFITRPLTPPWDVWTTALPSLQFSTFIASVFSTTLADKLKEARATTFLIPQNTAFERLGLVAKYLLRSTNGAKADLERVILHHVIDDVEYASALVKGTQKTYPTLEGSDLHMDRAADGTLWISPSGGWNNLRGRFVASGGGQSESLKSSSRTSVIRAVSPAADLLTRTGVIHEVDAVFIPRSVDITLDKLANAADGSTMAGLVTKAGLGWIMNGTKPPAESALGVWNEFLKWRPPITLEDRRLQQGIILDDVVGWVLLCPTETAFKGVNMTRLLADMDGMRRLVAQHLIPIIVPPSKPKSLFGIFSADLPKDKPSFSSWEAYSPISLGNKAAYSTILSQSSFYGDITFRLADEDDKSKGYIVGIKGARGTNGENDWANVLAWGRRTSGIPNSNLISTSAEVINEGGVIQIDRLLIPYEPKWWIEYGPPGVVLVIGVIIIWLLFKSIRMLWRKDTVEATYEPIGGFGREDDD